jgi:hypothetical protein
LSHLFFLQDIENIGRHGTRDDVHGSAANTLLTRPLTLLGNLIIRGIRKGKKKRGKGKRGERVNMRKRIRSQSNEAK